MQVLQQSSCVGTTRKQQRYCKGAVLLLLCRYQCSNCVIWYHSGVVVILLCMCGTIILIKENSPYIQTTYMTLLFVCWKQKHELSSIMRLGKNTGCTQKGLTIVYHQTAMLLWCTSHHSEMILTRFVWLFSWKSTVLPTLGTPTIIAFA